ncbi:hypothetical protein M7I_6809 [Glarea lozoyensis 74030]|uniref:Uncharacterized protein n=1 Tax=Glarea lozoyensis (strain ATCC 74030 / MF5533) TaxID=1104152 RepID=H0EVL0_GLAL7|nr:hypothetical protein M7I_6809 [Glarea lozoyensis 74030]
MTAASILCNPPRTISSLRQYLRLPSEASDCAAKLRERATPEVDSASARPDLPPRPKVQTGYAHVRAGRPRGDSGYFEDSRSRPSTRPISYSHVPVAGGRPVRPKLSHSPTYRARQFLAPEEPMVQRVHRTRRRSLPENNMSHEPEDIATLGIPEEAACLPMRRLNVRVLMNRKRQNAQDTVHSHSRIKLE